MKKILMTSLSVCSLGVSCNEMSDTPMLLVVQFKSVFTKKTSSKIPQMPGTSFPSINALNITEFGVFKHVCCSRQD